MKKLITTIVSIVVIIMFNSLKAAVVYVTPTGAGTQDGTSWTNASPGNMFKTSLDSATSGTDYWVAAGTYYAGVSGDRTATFYLKNGVGIYGGFAGTETAFSQRNISLNETTLSGDLDQSNSLNTNDAYHVVFCNNNDNTAILNGFTLKGGNADLFNGFPHSLGGGIFIYGGTANPTIQNCIITGNAAQYGGGGLASGTASSLYSTFTNCVFDNNICYNYGAAMMFNSKANFINCVFKNHNNTSGTIWCTSGQTINFTNCTFSGNNSWYYGLFFMDFGNISLINCIAWGNSNAYNNNGVYQISQANSATSNSSIVEGGWPGAGSSNLNTDPLFANAALELRSCSPGINSGTTGGAPAADILGNARPYGAAVDMGAYEYQGNYMYNTPTISISTATTTLCAGTVATFTAGISNGGANPQYHWKINNVDVSTAATFTTTALANNDVVTCVLTNNEPCTLPNTVTSNSLTITVISLPSVGYTISTPANVCPGTSVTLSGTGATSYSWSGGITDGVPFILNVSGTYTLTGTSNGCSNTALASVTANEVAPFTIVASGATTFCSANPITLAIESAPVLDAVPTSALAVGLHKLNSSYTGSALRLRRNSDNTEMDFGFLGNELDAAAISNWLNGANGYCTILYDQSGSGNNMTQASTGRQPLYVANGMNGKPVLRFNTDQRMFNYTNFTPPYSVIYAAKQTSGNRQRVLSSLYNNWLLGWWGGSKSQAHFDGWVYHPGSVSDDNMYIYSGTGSGSSASAYENGNLLATNSNGLSGPIGLGMNGGYLGGSEFSNCDFTDVFVFSSVLSDINRTAVERSIADYYFISTSIPPRYASYNWSNGDTTATISVNTTGTYTLQVTNANGCTGTSSNSITTSVSTSPSVSIAGNLTFCAGDSTVLDAGTGYTSYNWSTGDTTQTTTVSSTQEVTVTVTTNANACTGFATVSVSAIAVPIVNVTSGSNTICTGGSTTFNAGTPSGNYIVSAIPHSIIPVPNTANSASPGNNYASGPFSLPFTFDFFGQSMNSFHISTDGYIMFGATNNFSSSTPVPVPNVVIKKSVALVWSDLIAGSYNTIRYFVDGTAPTRKMVIDYTNAGYNSGGGTVSGQIWLYEGTGVVEVHLTTQSNTTLNKTLGVNNYNGTMGAAAPGRNGTNWNITQPEAWRFTPTTPYTFAWLPATALSSAVIHNPVCTATTTTTYSLTVTDPATGCANYGSINLNVTYPQGNPAVYGNGVWNVYAWNAGGSDNNANTAWNTNYSGYYTVSGLNFNSANEWGSLSSPSDAPGYSGCMVAADNHSWSAKREGFPCGLYSINIDSHDDQGELFVNNVRVWQHIGCCDNHTNVWSGFLSSADKVEFRVTEGDGNAHGAISFHTITPAISGDNALCAGSSTVLSVDHTGTGYLWSTGATTQNATITTGGTYTVTVTHGNDCTVSASKTVTLNPAPVITTTGGNIEMCGTNTVTLTASGADYYLWNVNSEVVPLDNVSGATLALGLRKLKSAYTGPCIRLKRDSDGAEMDFGFTGNDLNKTAITNWLGDANGYCIIMYDQSGNGGDVISDVFGYSPLLVLNGMNGKPVLHFDYDKFLFNSIYYTTPYTAIYGSRQTGGEHGRVLSSADNNWLLGYWGGGKGQAYFEGWINSNPGNPAADNVYHIYSGASNGSSSFLYEDGTQLSASSDGVAAPNGIQLNGWQYGYETSDVDITDVIMFGSELSSANRALVENSINDYYNSNHASITVAPASTTTYTVTGTGGNGCSATANTTVTVNSLPATPTISANGATTFCSGGSVVLTSSSATGNVWSNGATTQSITVNSTGNYYVTITNGNNCSATSASTNVTVNPLPTASIAVIGNTAICPGSSVVLTSSAASANVWSTGATSQAITVTSAGTYTLTVSNANNCSATTSVTTTTGTSCGPTTQLRTADCGKVNFAINASIIADAVAGATHYDFEFTNLSNNVITVKTVATNNYVLFSTITPAITYGTQYNVRVRAKVGGVYGSYGSVCIIGTVCNPNVCGVPLTRLRAVDCGKLNFSLTSGQVLADAVPAASHYEFEFRSVTTNAVIATKLQTSNVLVLNTVAPALLWGTQYNVKVRAYIGGVPGTYGTVCLIGIMQDPSVVGVPNTQLATVSCGASNISLTGSISCNAVIGAGSYEWEFKDAANTIVIAVKTTTGTSLVLNTVTELQWNTTYNVRVRGFIGAIGGNFSTSCSITLMQDPALTGVPSTKIRMADCGKLNLATNSSVTADVVSGAAEYEFQFSNPATNAIVAVRNQPSNIISLNNVSPALQWATQYNVKVRARIASTWGNFGTTCLIGFICNPALCGVPATKLRTSDCGKLNFNFSSGYAVADNVAGATQYEFEITSISSGNVVAVTTRATSQLIFSSVTPALTNANQYSIRVRAFISGVWGSYGTACTVGFLSASREIQEVFSDEVLTVDNKDAAFVLNVYPNPFNEQAILFIQSAKLENVTVEIIDLLGNLVSKQYVQTNNNTTFGSDFAQGSYIIKAISQSGNQATFRFIKSK